MNADPTHESKQTGEGAWIFLSHSHKDFEKVRQIRNEMERRGHNPLMFFLKCLESKDARLPELLKAEITARNWFILCDSPNAAASKWVQEEMGLIRGMEGKVFKKVDLSKGVQAELHKLVELSKRATVFISHAQSDNAVARCIQEALVSHDYRVWDQRDLRPGEVWDAQIGAAIDEAAKHGFVLLLLSPSSLSSRWCKAETQYALGRVKQSKRCNIVPVIVTQFNRGALPKELRAIQWFDLTNGRFEDRVEELIRNLKARDME